MKFHMLKVHKFKHKSVCKTVTRAKSKHKSKHKSVCKTVTRAKSKHKSVQKFVSKMYKSNL